MVTSKRNKNNKKHLRISITIYFAVKSFHDN